MRLIFEALQNVVSCDVICLLGCDTVKSDIYLLTLRSNVLASSKGNTTCTG
jgi:hypothetical protein